ncbi:MAG: YraN family protein [Prevotella sp.]|jgi:UPF0102 protein HMPREF0665_00879|nr:YraN family protein [Prevotella sp.]
MAKHNDLGRMGEDFAARYLAQQGYDIMERDWQQGSRDLDIIARTPDGITMVFVEVKTRTSDEIMLPEEAVTPQKIRHLGLAAHAYVQEKALDDEVRFDIINVIGTSPDNFQLEHIEDAFNPLLR